MLSFINMSTLKKNDIFTVTIDGYGSEAQGVCHIDGRAVFVPRAIPGEVWEIKILKVTNSAVFAKGEKLLSPSPSREKNFVSPGPRREAVMGLSAFSTRRSPSF